MRAVFPVERPEDSMILAVLSDGAAGEYPARRRRRRSI
jgi:hypothetical protein